VRPRHHRQPPLITATALELDIYVSSASWEGYFNSIEIWRSRVTQGGPYDALTGPNWSPASLPSGAPTMPPSPAQTGPSTALVGKSIMFLINGTTPLTVTFTGTDPTSFGTAATQINAQSDDLLFAFVVNNILVVQTKAPGAGVYLQVVGGDAAPLLGLQTREPGNTAFGMDARIPLVHTVQNYVYTDVNGSPDFWYKTRFYNSVSNVASDYSLPFKGRSLTSVGSQNLVLAYVNLVDMQGNGKQNQSILLFNRFAGTQVDGSTVVGDPINRLTDGNGYAEFLIVRGTKFTVAVSGTDLVRDITAPTDPTVQSFDLLDPAYGSNDLFNVQVPKIDYAVRRSL
jgi:hypothetical protein